MNKGHLGLEHHGNGSKERYDKIRAGATPARARKRERTVGRMVTKDEAGGVVQ